MAFTEALLLLKTPQVRLSASVQQTIGLAAAKLLEKIQQKKQLWADARLQIGRQIHRFVHSCSHCKTYDLRRRPVRRWPSRQSLCPQEVRQPESGICGRR